MSKPPRVLLVNPPSECVTDDRVEPPLGLLYLASALRERGHGNVSICDMSGCPSEVEVSQTVAAIPEADIYGIACLSTNFHNVTRIVDRIKSRSPSAYVILGGAHPSALPEPALEDSRADAVVVGEGEDALADSADAYARESPCAGVIRGTGRAQIDTYPFPARDLVDAASYSRRLLGRPVVSLVSSRGCVHRCIHCNSVVMGGGSRSVRYRSPDNVAREMASLRNEFECYRFNDDHFTGNPALEELLREIRVLGVNFRAFGAIEDLDANTCARLAQAGCVHVSVGLESLNPENLFVIGKGRQIGKEGNVRAAKDSGIAVRASFMVGLPHDNDDTVTEAFERAARLGLDEFAVYPLIPYPGTEIWRNPDRFGYTIVDREFSSYTQMGRQRRTVYALRHRNFTPDDVEHWQRLATRMLSAAGAKHMSESRIAT